MIVLNEISTIQDCQTFIEMIKKSKSLSHEPFKVSRLAFVHPVVEKQAIYHLKALIVDILNPED